MPQEHLLPKKIVECYGKEIIHKLNCMDINDFGSLVFTPEKIPSLPLLSAPLSLNIVKFFDRKEPEIFLESRSAR